MAAQMTDQDTSITALSPTEAYKLMQSDSKALLVDVRSDMEFLMVGHPVDAVHVAWVDAPDWEINPDFTKDVKRQLELRGDKNAPIILICRSGDRSDKAAQKLLGDGMTNLHVIKEGFEGPLDETQQRGKICGWRFDGLPWVQS